MAAKRRGTRRGARKKLGRARTIPRLVTGAVVVPKLAGTLLRPIRCPQDFNSMCQRLNAWAAEWEAWGERVKLVLNCVVDQCCTACDPGDPDPVPSPPKPPFA